MSWFCLVTHNNALISMYMLFYFVREFSHQKVIFFKQCALAAERSGEVSESHHAVVPTERIHQFKGKMPEQSTSVRLIFTFRTCGPVDHLSMEDLDKQMDMTRWMTFFFFKRRWSFYCYINEVFTFAAFWLDILKIISKYSAASRCSYTEMWRSKIHTRRLYSFRVIQVFNISTSVQTVFWRGCHGLVYTFQSLSQSAQTRALHFHLLSSLVISR